ncbi:hypothetical protein ACHAWU_009789 [Discostella pseudostelligera]|uniref:UBC core domain-containing protein n=1 Tax=Discostella pseudostelligera TaxID=259834 RepID=A0ABD3M7N5_9STRA
MAASTKRLLKERTNIARNPIPYVTFADDDNDDDDDDQNDTKMADASSSDNISQWRFILTLDPIHDSLEDSSEIGKAADSPYCCAPSSTSPTSASSSSTTGKTKGAAGLLAGVTRAATSRASKKSSSSNDTSTATSTSTTSSTTSSSTAEAAYFAFQLDFPATYPFKPPQITVLSPSYHPNIKKSSGEICDAILTGDGWGPTLNIRKICARLRKFLCEPDVQHPLETELGQLLSEKPGEYKVEAYKFARENASDRGKMVEEFLRKGGTKK